MDKQQAPVPVSPEEFRRAGHEVVEWIASYLENIRDYPVLPACRPGELTDLLPASAPEEGEPMEDILAGFRELIVPAVTHWNHPRFFGYFSITASEPGILGEMLAAALNLNGMLWKASPAVTELEQVVMGWLRQWLGLPPDFFGVIYDTASTSSLHAIACAREMAEPGSREEGSPRGLVMYCSELAHSSIEKGAITLGIGRKNVRKIGVDGEFRMRVEELAASIRADRAAGLRPFCAVATIGTTAVTSVDPVVEVARVCREEGMWLHVDAAYGGAAALLPEMRHVMEGADQADSLVMNPHKWLLTPVDLSAFFTRRPDVLRRAFSLVPEYLRTEEDPRAINLMDYGFQLGRRFRALKLWFIMRRYGRKALENLIREHIAMAREFASWVEADPDFELAAPAPFSLICFRHRGGDEVNRRLMERINSSGKALLSHAVIGGRFALRLAVGNARTTREDLRQTWEALREAAG